MPIFTKSFFLRGWIVGGLAGLFLLAAPHAFAATNVTSTANAHWAWNDIIGWIDFNPNLSGNVNVAPFQLTGYASSTVGPVSLNCDNTNPSGVNICGTSSYKVTNAGDGRLGGWAWNDQIGWISFFWGSANANPSSTLTSQCLTYQSTYTLTPHCGVYIDGFGAFKGWAWNDNVGWINFNCASPGSVCGTQYSVVTTWFATSTTGTLDSQTFDTGIANGAQLNSIMWKGSLNGLSYTTVGFQFAVSNSSSGPWNYGASYYPTGPSVPLPLTAYSSLAGRYFRYRITLTTNSAQTVTPEVDDVIVNWSP